jgi:MoaA/NifB/PqqE/SkfB family radical SAM enzyme
MNDFNKFIYHRYFDSTRKWYPFISVLYLTYRCDFRCYYCSDGSGKPYHALSGEVLPFDQVHVVLKKIRRNTSSIVLTGGEPLLHPGIKKILTGLRSLRFKEVVLTTNGYYLDQHLDEVAGSVTQLVISMDTLDPEKADAFYGKGKDTFKKITENILSAGAYPGKRYTITLSSVVTSKNIQDLYDVYRYAKERKFTFAAAPRLIGVKAEQSLADNDAYHAFFSFLIREKRRGARIFGSELYLSYLRDLKRFSCRPFTMLVVSPLGDIFYPCLEIGHHAGKIQDAANLHSARREGLEKYGPQPACDTRCHSACALSFGLLLKRPLSCLSELRMKRW